jgi:hypothetical protein
MLRIISFTVTQLPAPNYHCRAGEATAVRAQAAHWWNHIVVDLGTQVRRRAPAGGRGAPGRHAGQASRQAGSA